MLTALLPAALPLVCGALGFGLRRWQLTSAFEPTGLAIPGAPATLAMTVLCLVFLLLSAAVLFRVVRGRPALRCDAALFCPFPAYAAAMLCSAVLLAAGGLLELMRYVNHETTAITSPILAALLVSSGGAVLVSGKQFYRNQGGGRAFGPLLLPAFTWCLWLILVYQTCSSDPVLQNYVYSLLAIVAGLLGHYTLSTCSFEQVRPWRTLWCGSAAVFFSAVTLADGHDWGRTALFAFSIIYFTAQTVALLRNLTAVQEENTHE